ncbi:MAG: ATP-binding cassette domain-containing protein [Ignavibacteria bacterium]|nr:ATP-binding cassette domain-containing protein [Ignavibacteria bacterium]
MFKYKTYFRILTYLKPYWFNLFLSIICTILFALFNGLSVYLSIPLLGTLFNETQEAQQSELTTQSDNAFLPDFIDQPLNNITSFFANAILSGSKFDVLSKICVVILIAFLLKNIFGYLQAYFLSFVEQNFVKDFRDDAFSHLHSLPLSYFKNEKTGHLISKITNDAAVVQSISPVFFNLVREPLTIAVFIGIALSISWQLTVFSFLILPFSLLIIGWIGLKIKKQSLNLQEKMAGITSILEETINGVKIIKAFGMENYEINKFKNETTKYSKIILKMVRIKNAASPITEFLSVLIGVIIIFLGGKLVLTTQELKASEFLGLLFAIFQIMPPIKELSNVNNMIQVSSAAAERIFEIVDTTPDIQDAINPSEKETLENSIEFKNVSFIYSDSDDKVLDDVSFKVNKGQIIALVGSSGAGKTTLVDLIPRFYDPSDGAVLIDGTDIRDMKIENLRRLMGIVTQETVLFNESVKNNISYGTGNVSDEDIINAAKAANAHDFIMELPEGYNQIIGERGTKLSGGQRQRLSIARALLKNPPIMIFDEATSALDNESEVLVQQAIERLMKERTTFVIAHRLSTIRNADRILVLDHGKIIQDGSHDELIKNEKGLYKKLYDMQFR